MSEREEEVDEGGVPFASQGSADDSAIDLIASVHPSDIRPDAVPSGGTLTNGADGASSNGATPVWMLVAFLLALVPLAWTAWRFTFVCDDAFISFRYAWNLAHGHGLVFNLGVEPPVEGYTELLWVLLMALGLRGGIEPQVLSLTLSGLAGVGLVALCVRLFARVGGARPAALASGALLLGLLPTLGVWTSSGLATMPFAFALVWGFHALWPADDRPRRVQLAAAMCALVLLRADGAFWVAMTTGPVLLFTRFGTRGERGRAALVGALVPAAVFALHTGWRLWYYGDWMPNTARVKLGFSPRAFERGWDYVQHFGLTFPGVPIALALGIVGLALASRRARPAVAAALWIALSSAGYAVLVGGDFMAFGRFLVPALPFVAIGWAAFAGRLAFVPVVGAALALVLSLALGIADYLPNYDRHVVPESLRAAHDVRYNTQDFRSEFEQWQRMDWQAREWADLGKALAQHVEPTDSIVFGAVGAIGYFSHLFVYDLNGLVTREVALREPLGKKRSPGHDKTVETSFFLKDSPTWMGAFFKPQHKTLPPNFPRQQYLPVVLDRDYDRVKQGDLLLLQPGPGFQRRTLKGEGE